MSVSRVKDEKGAAMLIVIILMSILFMITSIVFGYALREYKLNKEAGKLLQVNIQTDTALTDVLEAIISQVEADIPIENFTVTRSSVDGHSANHYESSVYGSGHYDTSDFNPTGSKKNYRFDRTIVEPMPDPIPEVLVDDIAVEIHSTRGDYSVKRKLIIRVRSFEAETYDVRVIEAY